MSCEQCSSATCAARSQSDSGKKASWGKSAPSARIALLGQPNSGKSTLFNGLTGAHQHVGNWPGKTVERKVGRFRYEGAWFEVVDLPGSYSLAANSPEEEVTGSFVSSGESDVTVVFADASQLERSMYMLANYAGTNCPTVLALNMMDVAERQGKTIDAELLQKRLGIPVVPMVASDASYRPVLCKAVVEALDTHAIVQNAPRFDRGLSAATTSVVAAASDAAEKEIPQLAAARYAWIESVLEGVTPSSEEAPRLSKLDRWAIGSRASKPLALAMILLGFLLAFIPAAPIMTVGTMVSMLGQVVAEALLASGVPSLVGTFLSGVVFNSLCFGIMMVGYVFGVNLVFGIFEETGYMARISYVFDNTLARFGLQGKSVMPFLMCLGCTMGGVSGSRVVDSWGQRMLTVAMSWAVPCGTTWGVVPVLAVAFFGVGAPLVIVALFATAILLMWIVGRLFGPRLVPADARKGLVMELPPYHRPRMRNILRQSCLKSWSMFKRAIRVVALFSLVIWALTFSPSGGIEGSLLYAIDRKSVV